MNHADAESLSYADLMARTDAPAGSSWSLFNEHPERGMANFAGPDEVLSAVRHVRRGVVFNLDYPLDVFDPQIATTRRSPTHEVFGRHEAHRDDVLRDFYPQCSSQIDGFRHFATATAGFYNGVPSAQITAGTAELGIQRFAEHPIVGRGVLLDLVRLLDDNGCPPDHRSGPTLTVSMLDDALRRQHLTLERGDILLIHTGWAQWYLSLPHEDRVTFNAAGRFTGFAQDRDFLAWMWDHRIALLATDLIGIEVFPAAADSPFRDTDPHDNGMMHPQILARLGLLMGEIWNLTDLAADCAVHQNYLMMVTVKPLHLRGGVGSPPNAIAIR